MAHLEISLDGFVKELKTSSNGPHARKFCFVLGSGASKESGIPTGGELVNIWDRELTERNAEVHEKWKSDNEITEENKASFYSRFYRRRYGRNPSDGKNFLEKNMEGVLPNMGHFYLAYLLSRTKNRIVITTNFDRLVENAINDFTSSIPLVIGHDTLTNFMEAEQERPVVLKIHNDLLFDPKNTEEETEKLSEGWRKALDRVFQEYSPVFLGYGGNDRSVMDFLTDNAGKFQSGEWKCPYWTARKEFSKRNADIQKFLDEADGYYIQTSRFKDTMRRIGEEFEFHFPTEEEFLNEAREKYQKLVSTSIDGDSGGTPGTPIDPNKNGDGGGTLSAPKNSNEKNTEDGEKENEQQSGIQAGKNGNSELFRLADELTDNSKFEDALPIWRELVKKEPENPKYLMSLGGTLNRMGRYSEAVRHYQKALAILEPNNEADYGCVMTCLHYIVLSYQRLGEYEQAIEYLQEARAIREKKYGPEHEMTRWSYRDLASGYAAIGDADKAAEYRRKANAPPQPKT